MKKEKKMTKEKLPVSKYINHALGGGVLEEENMGTDGSSLTIAFVCPHPKDNANSNDLEYTLRRRTLGKVEARW